MTRLLTPDQVETYRRDGVLFPVRVMPAADAARYRAAFEAFERDRPDYQSSTRRQKLHLVLTWMAEIVRHPRILDAVEDLLGPDLLCWQTGFFIKEPRDAGYVSWHQDGNYWGLSSHEVVTAWLALSASTVASGCMKMLPGSHLWDPVAHVDTFDKDNLLTRGQVMQRAVDEGQALDIEVQPGEISLHHVNIAHASPPNGSGDRRIGIAIRYVTPRVKQVTGVPDSATLVRGEDRLGNFELEPAPAADFAPAAVALHDRVTTTRQGFIYKDAAQGPRAAS